MLFFSNGKNFHELDLSIFDTHISHIQCSSRYCQNLFVFRIELNVDYLMVFNGFIVVIDIICHVDALHQFTLHEKFLNLISCRLSIGSDI